MFVIHGCTHGRTTANHCKIIYHHFNSGEAFVQFVMFLWDTSGALVITKVIRFQPYHPNGELKVVRCRLRKCPESLQTSRVVKTAASCSRVAMFSIVQRG